MGIATAESVIGENIGIQLGIGHVEVVRAIETGDATCSDELQQYMGKAVLLSHHRDGAPLTFTIQPPDHDYDAYKQMSPDEVREQMRRVHDATPTVLPVLPCVGILAQHLPDYFVVTPLIDLREPPRISSYWSFGNTVNILKQGTLRAVSAQLRDARNERLRQAMNQTYPNFSKTKGPLAE
ncbi:hypothetical protein KDA23_02750 [Candidatus Saccharibacteria bacterium]|nr:hypothetical protein [Candidatus Saccharibacteria bacterium]